MARTYPRQLLDDELRSEDAERRTFDVLREGLSDEWEAFHSSAWVIRDHAEGALDGEIDFVLVHPQRGVLCLEVKGGGIECRYGEWYRLERQDGADTKAVRIKDPFWQALDHRYALERKLGEQPGWEDADLLIGHAVAFPYITIHQLALAPDAPREILLDRHAVTVDSIEQAIEDVLAYHRGARDKRSAPGERGAAVLRELLAPRVRIEVPMAAEFLEEAGAMVLLTHEQTLALERMRREPRMVITGCAGSGKTMLAVEHAKRLARDGKRVLFVCFNRGLRDHLRKAEHRADVEFNTFHGLCVQLAQKAKLQLPDHREEPPQSYWRDELPEKLADAAEKLGESYDAIMVDEGQDFHNHWLDALMFLLGDERRDPVWIFMDDNQRVYDVKLDVPHEFRLLDLTVNRSLVGDLAERRLEPLAQRPRTARVKLEETLLAWLDHQARVPEVAEALHVHPQTVRYRLGQLREDLGEALDDPDVRFELHLALRGRAGAADGPHDPASSSGPGGD